MSDNEQTPSDSPITLFGGKYPITRPGQSVAAGATPQSPFPATEAGAPTAIGNKSSLQLPLTLDLSPLTKPKTVRKMTLRESFEEFHRLNPHVGKNLTQMALQAKKRGVKRWAIKAMIEILRWEVIQNTTGDIWKINNNHAPFYARLLMEENPELRGFFSIRVRKEASKRK